MEARAVVTPSIGKVEFTSVTVPDPTSEDVVIQIIHSWISNGTEGSMIRGERIAGDTPRSDSDPMPFPHVPGYQKTGIVEWVGKNVRDIHIGDLVFATVSPANAMFYSHGGHVSPAVTHHSQVWKLPPDTNSIAVSGLVLTQVGYNVGMRPSISEGEAAVVLGDGLVGHWAAQTLQARGAKTLLIGKHKERLEKFEPASGDGILNLETNDLVETDCRYGRIDSLH
jgi:3-hydroxyethyl bacteriochlorophyllide a dehydrogenase